MRPRGVEGGAVALFFVQVVSRKAANQGDLLDQVIALAVRWKTTTNGGVRQIFAA